MSDSVNKPSAGVVGSQSYLVEGDSAEVCTWCGASCTDNLVSVDNAIPRSGDGIEFENPSSA